MQLTSKFPEVKCCQPIAHPCHDCRPVDRHLKFKADNQLGVVIKIPNFFVRVKFQIVKVLEKYNHLGVLAIYFFPLSYR